MEISSEVLLVHFFFFQFVRLAALKSVFKFYVTYVNQNGILPFNAIRSPKFNQSTLCNFGAKYVNNETN
jgi:hypothetical protein